MTRSEQRDNQYAVREFCNDVRAELAADDIAVEFREDSQVGLSIDARRDGVIYDQEVFTLGPHDVTLDAARALANSIRDHFRTAESERGRPVSERS